jgi:hypothetical protein
MFHVAARGERDCQQARQDQALVFVLHDQLLPFG